MSSIEEEIVSIRFDNSGFERKLSETLASLDKLAQSLKFEGAGQGLSNVAAAADGFDMSQMGSAVDNISSKFSALGAVGFTVIQSLTRSVFGFVQKIAGRTTDLLEPIISGGKQRAKNIDQAKFLFRGLGLDIEEGMANALAAVKGTSFSLDEAAKIAASFGASGIKLGTDMTGALRGVAGAAALTGTSFREMGDIFVSSAGTGIVNNQDLGQFATRGLNAAAAIAKVMGKTEAQIHEMASAGKLDFQTFANAMDEAFGEHATKANQTYEGSLANVRAAMSRMGASFFGPQQIQQRDLFNTLTPVIDNVTLAFKPLINTFLGIRQLLNNSAIWKLGSLDFSKLTFSMTYFSQALLNTFDAIMRILDPIKKAFKDIFPKSETKNIITFAQSLNWFTKGLKIGSETADKLRRVFNGFFSAIKIGIAIFKGLFRFLKDIVVSLFPAGKGFLNFAAALGTVITKIKAFLVDSGAINSFFAKIGYNFSRIVDVIRVAFRGIFPKSETSKLASFGEKLIDLSFAFSKFVGRLRVGLQETGRLHSIFSGFFAAIKIGIWVFKEIYLVIKDVVSAIIEMVSDILPAGDGVINFAANLGDAITKTSKSLAAGGETADKLRSIFKGVFSVIKIGIEVFKGIYFVIKDVVQAILSAVGAILPAGDGILSFGANLGDALTKASESLVEGGKIQEFFKKVRYYIAVAIVAIHNFITSISEGFNPAIDKVQKLNASIKGELSPAVDTVGKVGKRFKDRFNGISDIISGIVQAIDVVTPSLESFKNAFKEIGNIFGKFKDALASAFDSKDFNGYLDILNVGLVGGIFVVLKKLLSGGLSFDLTGGFLDQIKDTLDVLRTTFTDTMSAIQTQLKAKALLNIAIAIGVLTASVVVLSMIDSDALAKALTAIAVGMTELMTAMAVMEKMDMSGRKMLTLSAGLVILAGAIFILSLAVKIMSTMSLSELAIGLAGIAGAMIILVSATRLISKDSDGLIRAGLAMVVMAGAIFILSLSVKAMSELSLSELAKGLGGVAASMIILVAATRIISKDADGLIRAGIAMIAIAGALLLLSVAVKAFSAMSWAEMVQGLVGVAVGLSLIVIATKNMPKGMVAQGVGLILIATGLRILAEAVQAFGDMSLKEMGQGLGGLAIALLLVEEAVNFMPPNLPLIGAGLVLIAIALNIMALAVKSFASMDMEDMARGIGAIAVMLAVLSIAANSMSGAALGAASIIIIAGSLVILVDVLERLGKMSIGEIAAGLGAISAAFIVIGLAAVGATYIAPGLAILAITLLAIGAAAVIFGAGAYLIALAFDIMIKAGGEGVKVFKLWFDTMMEVIPKIIKTAAIGMLLLATTILEGLPPIIKVLAEIVSGIIDALIPLVPKLGELIIVLLDNIIEIIKKEYPKLVILGFEMIQSLLSGISNNIEGITTKVIEIITKFMDTMTENMPLIIASGTALIVSFLDGIAANINQIVAAGVNIIAQLLAGITASIPLLCVKAMQLIIAFTTCIIGLQALVLAAGVAILVSFITGIANSINKVVTTATNVVIALIMSLAANANRIVTAGAAALISFIAGIANNIQTVITQGTAIVIQLIAGIGAAAQAIVDAGALMIIKLMIGVERDISKVVTKGADVIIKFVEGLGKNAIRIINAAADVLVKFLNGLATAIRTHSEEIRAAGGRIASAIISGLTGGLSDKAGAVAEQAKSLAKKVLGPFGGLLGIDSPSKEFIKYGQFIGEGLAIGLDDSTRPENAATNMAKKTVSSFQDTLKNLSSKMIDLEDISPTIAPVLDLTKVKMEAKKLNGMMGVAPIVPEVSYDQARHISRTTNQPDDSETVPTSTPEIRDVTFNQNNYSPKALSTADVYRNTKSQIALAKKGLDIL